MGPFMAVIALMLKLESPYPVLYRSIRVGRGGRPKKLALFPRVSLIGRFLRRFSIDELPQFINVLRGDMSIVGPRPTPPSIMDAADHMRRLGVSPGLTGLWQVQCREAPTFESMIQLDKTYISNWSFWLELKILIRTITAVLTRSRDDHSGE